MLLDTIQFFIDGLEGIVSSFLVRDYVFYIGVGFALLSCWVLGFICSVCEGIEQMLEVARMYSSEVEYSEENLEKIKQYLDKNNWYD